MRSCFSPSWPNSRQRLPDVSQPTPVWQASFDLNVHNNYFLGGTGRRDMWNYVRQAPGRGIFNWWIRPAMASI